MSGGSHFFLVNGFSLCRGLWVEGAYIAGLLLIEARALVTYMQRTPTGEGKLQQSWTDLERMRKKRQEREREKERGCAPGTS